MLPPIKFGGIKYFLYLCTKNPETMILPPTEALPASPMVSLSMESEKPLSSPVLGDNFVESYVNQLVKSLLFTIDYTRVNTPLCKCSFVYMPMVDP